MRHDIHVIAIMKKNETCRIYYTDISCVRGVFAKYTSLEKKNSLALLARGYFHSLEWYILQIPF
jgi:hypothetical protein